MSAGTLGARTGCTPVRDTMLAVSTSLAALATKLRHERTHIDRLMRCRAAQQLGSQCEARCLVSRARRCSSWCGRRMRLGLQVLYGSSGHARPGGAAPCRCGGKRKSSRRCSSAWLGAACGRGTACLEPLALAGVRTGTRDPPGPMQWMRAVLCQNAQAVRTCAQRAVAHQDAEPTYTTVATKPFLRCSATRQTCCHGSERRMQFVLRRWGDRQCGSHPSDGCAGMVPGHWHL